MTRKDIRLATQDALRAAGFPTGSYAWIDKPNRLVVSVGGQIKIITLGGMSKSKLERTLGRIEGWRDMADDHRSRRNGFAGEADVSNTFAE